MSHYYRPQTKFAKVMFLHVSVCPQGEGWYPSMHCRWYPSMPCIRSPGGWYASMPCRFPCPHLGGYVEGNLAGGGFQAHTQGEVEGSGQGGLQAHTQGDLSHHALRQTPPPMATAVGCTYPTGMHSCILIVPYTKTRKHSSKMRTACLETVRASVSVATTRQRPRQRHPPPDRDTPRQRHP